MTTSKLTLSIALLVALVYTGCQKLAIPKNEDKPHVQINLFNSDLELSGEIGRIYNALKIHNEKTNFSNELPSNIGQPIWEKCLAIKGSSLLGNSSSSNYEGANIFVLPMTSNGANLSSVIFIELEGDSVHSICPVSSEYLYQITHTNGIDLGRAKTALGLFLIMENQTFGLNKFANIPKNIFPDIQFKPTHRNYVDIVLDTANQDMRSQLNTATTCWNISWQVINCGTPNYYTCIPQCDKCGTSCTYENQGITMCSTSDITGNEATLSPSGVVFPPPPTNTTTSGSGSGGGSTTLCNTTWYQVGGCNSLTTLPQLTTQLNNVKGLEDSWSLDNSVTPQSGFTFSSVSEFQSFLQNKTANTSYSTSTSIPLQINEKLVSIKVYLLTFPFQGGVDISVKVVKDATGKYIPLDVKSDDFGYTLGWSWNHIEHQSSISGNNLTVIVKGKINYNIVIDSWGTIYKQIKYYKVTIDRTTGNITAITEVLTTNPS